MREFHLYGSVCLTTSATSLHAALCADTQHYDDSYGSNPLL